ncbi:hypothetical protein P7K49_027333 [Saguinus oedipus]|uniref:IF rod domain-containing protein n=1 Tax=Saguinus oedipus TaxID=9490 RepID=A0ABQ9U9Z3_SAGOE|nr:hypothetical protein P7K49_027333 [Saguinus oedipus]
MVADLSHGAIYSKDSTFYNSTPGVTSRRSASTFCLQIIYNAHLTADNFGVKYETKLVMCQSVESDIHRLHRVSDDTNVTWLQQETDKAVKEELLFMEKNHKQEIDLQSMRNLKAPSENSLREVEACYAVQMEQLNRILLHLESELAQTWAEGQHQAQEYKTLLNIKVKLEAEIATYRRLLEDSKDFNPGDALDSSNSMQTIQNHHPPNSGWQSGI